MEPGEKEKAKQKVLSLIDGEDLTKLATELVSTPSPAGREGPAAQLVLQWLKANGIKTVGQQISESRMNAVGILPGTGGGLSLMFNGHLDVVYTGLSDEEMLMGLTEPKHWPQAKIAAGRLTGPGIANDKAAVTAFLVAGKAIKEAGIPLKGDLVLAAVAGEIERAPVGPYQGQLYCGAGAGTYHLLNHGITSDYVLVAEPSGFAITWALPGAVYARITTFGQATYTPYLERPARWQKSPNAIVKLVKLLDALETWAENYEKENQYPFEAGTICPRVNIGAVLGGLPFKPNYSAGQASAYIDVRIPPGKKPGEIKEALEKVARGLEIDVEIELFRSQKGYHSQESNFLVKVVTEAYQQVFEAKPESLQRNYTSSWNDLNIYHEKGIPGVKFGPRVGHLKGGEGTDPGMDEFVEIEDLVKLAQVYALAALEVCSTAKKQ